MMAGDKKPSGKRTRSKNTRNKKSIITSVSKSQSNESFHTPSHIVGVGASAGGLGALESFFKAIPPETDLAFVVVQHLSPDFKSVMDELLARQTSIQIKHIETGMNAERNCIYLLPPRKNLLIREGKFQLVDYDPLPGLHLPIDIFFDSLADDQLEKSIGIILSGTGSDGSRGICRVKEAGGLVMVQSEESAKFDGMPRSAIATGLVDFIASPQKLAEKLLQFISHPFALTNGTGTDEIGELSKLEEIIRILNKDTKIDFSQYKLGTASRRIGRRMGINHLHDLNEYISLLQKSKTEPEALAKDLLIGVTRFFRDPDAWEYLRREVVPKIIEDQDDDGEIRIWCAACSTGEEAYSLAITIREGLEELKSSRSVKIFASDIDQHAVETAAAGVFPETIAAEFEPKLLKKYFLKKSDGYEICKSIRQMILFTHHNVLKDPPFNKLHLVTCRNVLIYFRPEAQKRALSIFHFSLKRGGYLFLGPSENISDLGDAFTIENSKLRIFKKNPGIKLPLVRQEPESNMINRLNSPLLSTGQRNHRVVNSKSLSIAHEFIADKFCPPALLVSNDFQIINCFGEVGHLFTLPKGGFSSNISKLAAPDLRLPLNASLHRALKKGEPVFYNNIQVKKARKTFIINMEVQPLGSQNGEISNLLVILNEQGIKRKIAQQRNSFEADKEVMERVAELEKELDQTRENLQAAVEALQTSNEELLA